MPDGRVDLDGGKIMTLSGAANLFVVETGEVYVFVTAAEGPAREMRHFVAGAGPGEVFCGGPQDGGLVWMATGLPGTSVRPVDPSEDTASARGRWLWAVSEHMSDRWDALETTEAPPRTPSLEEVSSHMDHFAEVIERAVLDSVTGDRQRMERSALRDAKIEQEALRSLSGVLARPRAAPIAASDDPLLEACKTVAEGRGFSVEAPSEAIGRQGGDPLKAIAKASSMRLRRVTLVPGWWDTDSGPLLGFAAEDGRPLALMPVSAHSYEVIDHERGVREPLDEHVAGTLGGTAFRLYGAWDTEALSVGKVLRSSLFGTKRDLIRMLAYGLASGILALATPLATAVLFNDVIPQTSYSKLAVLIGVLLISALATVGFQLAQGFAAMRVEARMDEALQSGIWDRLLRLPVSFFRGFSVGDLVYRALSVDNARQVLSQAGAGAILGGVFSLSSFVLLFVFDPGLALVAAVLLLSLGGIMFWALRRFATTTILEERGDLQSLVVQQVAAISKLRVAGAERRAFAEWASQFRDVQRLSYGLGRVRAVQAVASAVWPAVSSLVLFWWISRRGLPEIDPGTLIAFLAAYTQVLYSLINVSTQLTVAVQVVPLFKRVRPILEASPEVDTSKSDPGLLTGAIEISHVTFRYDEEAPLVLDDIDISIRAGEFLAVVGPSGSGKSTLLRLMLGFEDPTSGSVYYDGQDLSSLDVEVVRQQMGVVVQTAQLILGTIYSNIAGALELPRDRVWEAAERAGVADDIRAMPMGLDTVISEGGSSFSGGQKQRILIARAIAQDPRILLFDEATSALDNVTQKIVADSLRSLSITRLTIAHRLSTVIEADRIIVIEHGRLVESGTYTDLMAADGPFSRLAARQLA